MSREEEKIENEQSKEDQQRLLVAETKYKRVLALIGEGT
jgi:hypothetical protein